MKLNRCVVSVTVSLAALAGIASGAFAQAASSSAAPVAVPSTGVPQRDTLMKMMRPVTAEFKDQRLEDVIKFVAEFTGAEIDAMWQDDRNPIGLDKEQQINLKADNLSALALIERVLDKAMGDTSGTKGNTWQMSQGGDIQIGPRERLDKFLRVEIYDINDLLMVLPDYTNAPEFDLNSVLQSGRGGGGQSPFSGSGGRGGGQNAGPGGTAPVPKEERAKALTDLLVGLCEPNSWVENGNEPATMKYYQGMMIINAPDYVHRALDGYPYWPKNQTTTSMKSGRRYVSLNGGTSTSKVKGFAQTDVTAVVGGQLINSGGPGR